MIKVNLMRNRVQDAGANSQQIIDTGAGNNNREAVVKIVCIFIAVIGLKVWERQSIQKKNAEVARIQAKVTDLEAQTAEKAIEVEGIKDIVSQAQELEDKLKVLKLLSKLRLREVKTLDFMQTSIPEKVWLKGLNYDADN